MKLIRKLALKFNNLKADPRYAVCFMLVVFLWYLWDRVHNPLFPNLELFLSVEASLGTFVLYQNQGQKTAHDKEVERMLKQILKNQKKGKK